MHVLLIDDDTKLTNLLAAYLTGEGFVVDQRADGASGLGAISLGAFDAIVLDVMLPDLDGFEVLTRLRTTTSTPVLMLTAKGEPTDRVRGLDLGADDYLSKPFDPRELVARLRAITRRVRPTTAPEGLIQAGRLEIDLGAREVRLGGSVVPLTSYQFAILLALAQRPGRVLDREHLMRLVRGDDSEAFDRSIDVHVSRIRALIEADPREPKLIRTVRGAGYVFTATPAVEPVRGGTR
jgi:two-component system phosphate regulon response regulator OmpR